VNGLLYDYVVDELCGVMMNPYAPLMADAFEIPVDPTLVSRENSAVAAGLNVTSPAGTFYTGLTRDDIGGLRSLYATTNVIREAVDANSVQAITNQTPQILTTMDFNTFAALTNTTSGAALAAMYPGLVVSSSTVIGFSNAVTTTYTAVATTPPFGPTGQAVVTLVPVLTTNIVTLYSNVFQNIVIVSTNLTSSTTYQTVSLTVPQFGPANQFVQTTNNFTTYTPDAAFYILPATLCGPYQIVSTQLVTTVSTTTAIPINTTAVAGGTATGLLSASLTTTYPQLSLVVYPVNCVATGPELREGMDVPAVTNFITFIRQDYDSLLGTAWTPATNYYQLTAISNGVPIVEHFRRTLTVPDIILSAANLAVGPAAALLYDPSVTRTTPHFNVTQVPANQGGPGTITPEGINFVYNSSQPIYIIGGNPSTSFVYPGSTFGQILAVPEFQWGSFDGTTNNPIVYPSTTSLASLQAQLFFQITNTVLASASVSTNVGVNKYSQQLGALGGSPPYTWSLASGSPGLPTGLSLSAAGVISGSPTTQGTYDFIVQAKDAGARVTQTALAIVVGP
jgi:hypothetical protein